MLDRFFLQILNMSFTASYIILVVLLARILLKKAPKIFSYSLWSVVLFRLICPFSFESILSILPTKSNPIPVNIGLMQNPQIDTGIPVINNTINPILPEATPVVSINPMQIWIFTGQILWLCGIVLLLIYSLVTLYKLTKKLKRATPLKENIYLSDNIRTAFVLGVLRPKIYLPLLLRDKEQEYILLHEKTHIKRLDHIVKILAFLVLCVHWFNPFVWLAFFAFSKDMELSCDEAVIRALGNEVKKDYSASLLRLATGRRIIGGTPLAFGEGDTKNRVKNVLSYKKPAFWAILVTALACVVAALCLVSNPKKSNVTDAAQLDYFIMTDEIGAIGCEYGINKDNQLDTLQMLSALEDLKGFKFDTDWASHGYVKFVFNDKKPEDVFLRYCANVDDIWQQEYPIDSTEYKIKIPSKAGIYNFFADITWENGEQETSYFNVTVAEKQEENAADPLEEKPLILTKEAAAEFVNQTLGTFKLNSDNTVSFTLPAVIPADESGKTELYISSSATFSPEPGTSSVQEILDWKDNWQGGESYIEKLDMSRGKLTRIFLRVAFMTSEGENSYREYAADYLEFTEPFKFDTPVRVTDRSVEINKSGESTVLKYTMQNGGDFSIALILPKGLTLSTSENYPEYASKVDYEMPTVVAVKGETPIGTLTLSGFGTEDKDALTQMDTAENILPMQIFAPVALSNHAEFDNYRVCKSSATGANATAKYLWQDLTDYGGRAPDAPWLESDCILAYDYEKVPFFINLNLADGSLSITELENLAKSIVIADGY